jgi:hypothetical protein
MLAAGSTRVYADGFRVQNTSSTPQCFATEHTGGTGTATTTTNPTNGSPAGPAAPTGGVGPVPDNSLITSLMGLVANQFAGAGVKGGGTGYDGPVTAPIEVAAPAASSNHGITIILILLVVGIGGYFLWKNRKKAK